MNQTGHDREQMDDLTAALRRIAERAPARGPSAATLLAVHKRRIRTSRTLTAAALTAAGAVAVTAAGGPFDVLRGGPTSTAASGPVASGPVVPEPVVSEPAVVASPPKRVASTQAAPGGPNATVRRLLQGRDLDQRWAATLGTLAGDADALTAIRGRAFDLLGRGVQPADLRILLATDLTTPTGARARVVVLTGPPDADPPHRAIYFMVGRMGADPSTLTLSNAPGPFIAYTGLEGAGDFLVAAPPGTTVTVETRRKIPTDDAQPLATAQPVPGVPGLYTLPPQPDRYAQIVSRQDGELVWWEPFTTLRSSQSTSGPTAAPAPTPAPSN